MLLLLGNVHSREEVVVLGEIRFLELKVYEGKMKSVSLYEMYMSTFTSTHYNVTVAINTSSCFPFITSWNSRNIKGATLF